MNARLNVFADREQLAAVVAARFVDTILTELQDAALVHVALTGGTVGIRVLEAIADEPRRDELDWSRIHLWWSDERWLPSGDPERNEQQARDALLDGLGLGAATVHRMPASDTGVSLDEAALDYAAELAEYAADDLLVPRFAVALLGVGPDGHIASLFPGHPGAAEAGEGVIAVRESPKPPPERLSLTLAAVLASARIWCCLAGQDKAEALVAARGGDRELPFTAVLMHPEAEVFADEAAASLLAGH